MDAEKVIAAIEFVKDSSPGMKYTLSSLEGEVSQKTKAAFQELMNTPQWQEFRDSIFDREEGK